MADLLLLGLAMHGLLSTLNQFRRFQPILNKVNRLSLLPYWSFFAPIPGTSDHRIVRRTRSETGVLAPWQEVEVYRARSLLHLVWNPNKHAQKCVSDCVAALIRQAARNGTDEHGVIQLSWPYLKLAQFAFAVPPGNEPGSAMQFAVVDSTGLDNRVIRPLFVSRWHQ